MVIYVLSESWLSITNINSQLAVTGLFGFRQIKQTVTAALACPLQDYVVGKFTFRRSTLKWRHNGCDSVSNHQPHDCLLNRLFRRRSKKTAKLRVTGLCVGNSPGTGDFPAQMASNAENVSIWWRHHDSEHNLSVLVFVKLAKYLGLCTVLWANTGILNFIEIQQGVNRINGFQEPRD